MNWRFFKFGFSNIVNKLVNKRKQLFWRSFRNFFRAKLDSQNGNKMSPLHLPFRWTKIASSLLFFGKLFVARVGLQCPINSGGIALQYKLLQRVKLCRQEFPRVAVVASRSIIFPDQTRSSLLLYLTNCNYSMSENFWNLLQMMWNISKVSIGCNK